MFGGDSRGSAGGSADSEERGRALVEEDIVRKEDNVGRSKEMT